jgi:hypothetical protein
MATKQIDSANAGREELTRADDSGGAPHWRYRCGGGGEIRFRRIEFRLPRIEFRFRVIWSRRRASAGVGISNGRSGIVLSS